MPEKYTLSGVQVLGHIAMQLLNPAISRESMVKTTTGLNLDSLKNVELLLKENAYRAFIPELLDVVFSSLASSGEELNVVQVGANDGVEQDPVHALLHYYSSKALLIEPIPQLIPALRESYQDYEGELIIENVAIGSNEGEFKLHILSPKYWDEYLEKVGRHPTAISSYDVDRVTALVAQRLGLDVEQARKCVQVVTCPMYTLEGLLSKHAIDDVDVLQVDCEGFDIVVIKSLGPIRPRVINFESLNLHAADWGEWKEWAEENGYGWIRGRMDTLAVRGAMYMIE